MGAHLQSDGRNFVQIENRTSASLRALGKLRELGIYSNEFSPSIKANLYITMIRSILLYASDCTVYSKDEIKSLKIAEGNAIKDVLGISRHCYTSEITAALGIDKMEIRLKINKLKFMII